MWCDVMWMWMVLSWAVSWSRMSFHVTTYWVEHHAAAEHAHTSAVLWWGQRSCEMAGSLGSGAEWLYDSMSSCSGRSQQEQRRKHQLLSCHLSPASCCYSCLSSSSWLLPPDGIWYFDNLFLKVLFVAWCCRAALFRCHWGKVSFEITGFSPQLWHWPQAEQLDLYFQVAETFCFLHVSVLESVITHSAKRNRNRSKHLQLQRNSTSCCLHHGAWVHLRLSHWDSSWIQPTPESATVWWHRVILLWKKVVKTDQSHFFQICRT